MKYPKDVGPQTQSEMYAWIFGMLANAWNLVAQYEADERARDAEEMRQDLIDHLSAKHQRSPTEARDESC